MSKLKTKTALVTGASKGIGAAIALQLASSGAAVAVNYATDSRGGEAIARTISDNGGQAIAVQANVSIAAM